MNEWFSLWVQSFPVLIGALGLSLLLTITAIAIGYPIGLLLALGTNNRNKILQWASIILVETGRGAPILVVLYLLYFGLPKVGWNFSAFAAAIIALAFNAAAFSTEMIRAGIQSVPQEQREAGQALGLSSFTTFFVVIFPQGIRSSIPALMGLAILLFQATSLAYSISVPELMHSAHALGATNFQYLNTFTLAGVIYASISIPVTWMTVYLERKLSKNI